MADLPIKPTRGCSPGQVEPLSSITTSATSAPSLPPQVFRFTFISSPSLEGVALAGVRNLPLACVDIVIVRTTIIRCVLVALLDNKWVTVAQVTYFVWVSIATAIQLSIKAMS